MNVAPYGQTPTPKTAETQMKQAQMMELIQAGAFSTYKQAGVPEQHWEALLDRQATKWAEALQAKERRTKIASAIRNSPRVKAAMAAKK
jgi:hypothetical protein